jgi:hypothetical protein
VRALVLFILLLSTPVWAHSLVPGVSRIGFRPGNPNQVILETNFGLVQRDDLGKWSWVCEEAIAGDGVPTAIHLAPSGETWVATFAGLFVSSDNGCHWTSKPELSMTGASDIEGVPGQPSILYATSDSRTQVNRLRKSVNGGSTFTDTALVDPLLLTSVRIAPSNTDRLYVAAWGFDPLVTTWLFRSDDGGASFEKLDLTARVPSPGATYVWAVHPTDPDVFFVTVEGTTEPYAKSLLRSDDGGDTFTEVFSTEGIINGVLVSPDGSIVWVAAGNRIFRSVDGGASFSPLNVPRGSACVDTDGTALYTCGRADIDGWSVGRSGNDGDSFEKVMELDDITGPLECPADSPVTTQCPQLWEAQRALFSFDRLSDAGEDPEPTPDAGENPNPGPPRPTGCGCEPSGSSALALMSLVALLSGLNRRRLR